MTCQFRLTQETIWDDVAGVRDDAELGDVVRAMFVSCYDDAPHDGMLAAVARSSADEMAILKRALEDEQGCSLLETERILDRMRNRLLVATWLDRRLKVEADERPDSGSGAPSRLHLSAAPVWDREEGGLREDVELGDAIRLLMDAADPHDTISAAVANSNVDELALLELVLLDGRKEMPEARRVVDRMRRRTLIGKWLDRRVERGRRKP